MKRRRGEEKKEGTEEKGREGEEKEEGKRKKNLMPNAEKLFSI